MMHCNELASIPSGSPVPYAGLRDVQIAARPVLRDRSMAYKMWP